MLLKYIPKIHVIHGNYKRRRGKIRRKFWKYM